MIIESLIINKMNNYKRSIIFGYLRLIIHYVSNFMLVPLMLSALGDKDYGVYKIMTAISAYFIIADGGLSNTSVKFLSELRVKKDAESQKEFCGIAFSYYSIVSIILGIIGVGIYLFIPHIYKNSLSVNEVAIAQRMVLPLVLTYCLKLFTSLFRGYIKAYEQYDISKFGEIIQDILRFIFIYVYIKLNGSAVGCVVIDLIITIIVLAFYIFFCVKFINFSIKFKFGNIQMYRKVFSFSGAILLETIAYQVFWTADSIILGIMTSASCVAIYSIATTINGYFQSISNVSNEFLMPEIIKHNANDMNIHFDRMVTYARLKLVLLGLMTVGIVLLGRQFVFLWVGDNYEQAYYLLLILMIPQLFIQIMDYPANLMWIMGKQNVRAYIMICIALSNIILTVIGIKRWGLIGASVSTAISLFVGQGVISAIYYWKAMKIDIWGFYRKSFSKIWEVFVLIIILGKCAKMGCGKSWISLIIQIIIVSIIYLFFVFAFSLSNNERNYLIRFKKK